MADDGHRRVQLDSRQVITLAHPLRSRLLSALRVGGPATSTVLATQLGTNSGTSSYHLRRLAEVGLVEEAGELGDGRDRWWRAAQEWHSIHHQDFTDEPDARAASDWLYAHYFRVRTRHGEDWIEDRHRWPVTWQAAANMSDYLLRLTPDQLSALNVELDAVLSHWRETEEPDAPGAEQVIFQVHAFPFRRPSS